MRLIHVLPAALVAGSILVYAAAPAAEPSPDVARGKYLVQIAGCNDCHTPGYAAKESKVDEKLWLTGDTVGWRGPWGTTYAANLRLVANVLSEDQWVKRATSKELRPPMPWFNVRDMSERDVKAIYSYFARHEVDKQSTRYEWGSRSNPSPGYIAWLLWGGDDGKRWAKRQRNKLSE